MKKTALILLASLSLPVIMIGQEANKQKANKSDQHRTSRFEKMATDLELTESQRAEIKAIHATYKPRIEEARGIEDTEDRKMMVREIRAEERSAINAKLTPDQQEQFKNYHQKKKHEKMHRMKAKK